MTDRKGVPIGIGDGVLYHADEGVYRLGLVTSVDEDSVSLLSVTKAMPMGWSLPPTSVQTLPLLCEVVVKADGRRIAETVLEQEMP
jgi:hypothetical protein